MVRVSLMQEDSTILTACRRFSPVQRTKNHFGKPTPGHEFDLGIRPDCRKPGPAAAALPLERLEQIYRSMTTHRPLDRDRSRSGWCCSRRIEGGAESPSQFNPT